MGLCTAYYVSVDVSIWGTVGFWAFKVPKGDNAGTTRDIKSRGLCWDCAEQDLASHFGPRTCIPRMRLPLITYKGIDLASWVE